MKNKEPNTSAPPIDSQKTAFPALWEKCSDAVIVADSDLSVIHMNPAARSMMADIKTNTRELQTAQHLLTLIQTSGLLAQSDVYIPEFIFDDAWISISIINLDNGMRLFFLRDIGEEKALSEQLDKLKETNSELNEIIELSADGLVSVDHSGIILRLNKAYKRILGIKNENFIGKPAQLLVDKGYLPELVSAQVLKRHKPTNIMVTLKNKDVLLTGRPVFNEQGRLVRVVANIRDLTKLNNLKNQLDKYHELANRYETEIHHLRAKEIESKIIGRSPGASKMIALAAQASKVDSTVLVYGETGTGKEVLVKTIHKLSDQKKGPFIAVNCSSVPESLMESELFGYESGAFTGSSKKGKIGLFEAAHTGTLFLDEISEMPASMQTKLLRVIQEKKVRRIGANKDRGIDVRLIAASNKRLKTCVEAGQFREDLYYRLNIINIDIPPLRERKEDIPLLIKHFLDEFNVKFDRQKTISEKEMLMLIQYNWPGNIRELQNMIERYVVLSNALFLDSAFFEQNSTSRPAVPPEVNCLKSYLKEQETAIILDTYDKLKSTRKTANALNVSQSTIVRKLSNQRKTQ